MSEQTPADASPADDAATDQSPADTAQTLSLDEAKKLRSEAANLRRRLKEAESKVQAAEDEKKPELERLLAERDRYKADHDRMLAEVRAERAEKAIRDAAATASGRPDRLGHVYRLVRDGIEFDDDGKPANVAALIAQAKTDSPEWFQAVAGSGDGGKTGATDSDPNAAINAAIRQMAGHR